MRITFIIQDLFQQGAQYVTALMVRGFVAKGYDVDLIVSKVHSDILEQGDIKPYEVPPTTNTITLSSRRASRNIGEIRRYLQTTDSIAVISMSSNYNAALALASFGLFRRPKIAYVEHLGLANRKAPSFFSPEFLKARFLASRFDALMAVSAGIAKVVEKSARLKRGKVKVVYNPVIDSAYRERLAMAPSHKWLKDKTMPTFVAAGAHSAIKGHMSLFEAIKKVNEYTPVRLVLFGKGQLTEQYRQWIEENSMDDMISLASHTTQLPAELKASDGLIISSLRESFSLVLVEAMAAGVPVISTDCPFGPPELLNDGEYGTLVPVGDIQTMADTIINQIKSPRAAAPPEAWTPYTLENVVAAYEQVLGI